MKANIFNIALRGCTAAITTLAMAAMVSTAHAQVTNGSFSDGTTNSTEIANSTYTSGATVAGWSVPTNSFNFSFDDGKNTATGSFGAMTLKSSGFASGVTSFAALDTDYPSSTSGSIQETLTGLKAGTLTVTFEYAVDQQTTFNGSFTTTLDVSLNGVDSSTATPIADWTSAESSSPAGTVTYVTETATFNVTAAEVANPSLDVLKFAATSVSSGNLPSFLLLTDVTAAQPVGTTGPVPEPGSLALLSTGLLGLGGFVRSRFGKKA